MTVGQIPGWVKIDTEMLYAGGQHFRTGTTLVLSAPATATHSLGATVTYAGRPYDADFLTATGGGGGGAIAVTGSESGEVPAATGLVLPGIVTEDAGVAISNSSIYVQTTDPGAVGVGAIWKDITLEGAAKWYERNGTNDGWNAVVALRTVSTEDGNAESSLYAVAETGDGQAIATSYAESNGVGAADVSASASGLGGGGASAGLYAYTESGATADALILAETTTGLAQTSLKAKRGATTTGFAVEVSAAGVAKVTALGLPTADPVVAGQLWIDTAAARVLKVSAG